MAHSKEPWREGKNYGSIVSEEGAAESWGRSDQDAQSYGGHLVCESACAADRRRIIACVNLLAGVPTDDIETIIEHKLERTVYLQARASARVARMG